MVTEQRLRKQSKAKNFAKEASKAKRIVKEQSKAKEQRLRKQSKAKRIVKEQRLREERRTTRLKPVTLQKETAMAVLERKSSPR